MNGTPKSADAALGTGIHSRRRKYGGTLAEQICFVEAN